MFKKFLARIKSLLRDADINLLDQKVNNLAVGTQAAVDSLANSSQQQLNVAIGHANAIQSSANTLTDHETRLKALEALLSGDKVVH